MRSGLMWSMTRSSTNSFRSDAGVRAMIISSFLAEKSSVPPERDLPAFTAISMPDAVAGVQINGACVGNEPGAVFPAAFPPVVTGVR